MGETIQVLARKYMAWKYFRGGYAAQRRGNQRQAFILYEKSLEFFPTGESNLTPEGQRQRYLLG